MGKRKLVTQEEYNKVRLLLNAGLKPSMVKQVTGFSYATIHRMQANETFSDYKEYVAKVSRHKAPLIEPVKAIDAIPVPPIGEHEVLLEISLTLKSIDSNIKFLAEHMPVETRRKFFK